jgi:RimJ/RimL family protein N-acetyltransferase
MTPPACIETPRLLLRPWTPDDADALIEVLTASHAALVRWTPWVLEESDTLDALRRKLGRYAEGFETGPDWRYAIVTRGDGARIDDARIVGGASLHARVGPGAIEIGYWLATAATGQGFATEAAAALTAEAFRMSHIERVEIRCDPANAASMRVPERLHYRARPSPVHEPAKPGRPAADVVVWDRPRAGGPAGPP